MAGSRVPKWKVDAGCLTMLQNILHLYLIRKDKKDIE